MERLIIYLIFIIIAFIPGIVKQTQKGQNPQMPGQNPQMPGGGTRKSETSAMPHKHKKDGVYETYSRKTHDTKPGAMPHKHEKGHYTSMCDASNLPKGYILLNGEPVRVADLEDK